MPLPLTTTTVTISRLLEGVDPYEEECWSIITSDTPAVISGSSGTGANVGGAQQVLSATLYVDGGTDVKMSDRVTDNTSGDVWLCDWVRRRYELGLAHVTCGLTFVEGATN